jgi:hypothetical protein
MTEDLPEDFREALTALRATDPDTRYEGALRWEVRGLEVSTHLRINVVLPELVAAAAREESGWVADQILRAIEGVCAGEDVRGDAEPLVVRFSSLLERGGTPDLLEGFCWAILSVVDTQSWRAVLRDRERILARCPELEAAIDSISKRLAEHDEN